MDMGDKENFELEKRNDDPMNYHSSAIMSSDWRLSAPNFSNVSMGVVPSANPMTGSSSYSTASIVDSYSPTLWDQPNASLRSVHMGWNPQNSMLKGSDFLPGMLPQSLSQFPTDSAFIERAARFSNFSGGSFSDIVNPFCVPEPMALYSRNVGMVQGRGEDYPRNELKSVPGEPSQKKELNVGEASKNVSLSLEQGAINGSPMKNEGRSESLVRSGNESDEAEFSGGGGQDEPSTLEDAGGESSAKEIGLKKRKRSGQDTELDKNEECDFAKDKAEVEQKDDQNPGSATNKATGKQGKSDSAKDDYIHVRARRGQATNSHSLAERVRREKISERMKFLQDLVPGCNKVTGKAVMLDEIINYVQSLQRQVEFLSMKLAMVNPRLDVNIEGLLAKDLVQSRHGPSSSLGYAPDMPMTYLHPSQPGLIQGGGHGIESSNVHRRNINPQLMPIATGFKEPSQVLNMWEHELQNVVQINFGTNAPLGSQEMNESAMPSQMKVEL